MDDDDAQLVALIDGELDEESRRSLVARMERDENLRLRYERLRKDPASIAAAFDLMLTQAPVERLKAALPKDPPGRRRRRFVQGFALRDLAAGFVAGLIVAGAAAWFALRLSFPEEGTDWRSAVAEYTDLYTNETFSPLKPDAALEAAELAAVGERVGVKLTPEKVALPGLRFTVAFLLSFANSPLAAIAFVDPQGEPVLFCITDNHAARDSPMRTETRDALSMTSWSRGGRSFLVIGRKPEARIAELAQTLYQRI